MDDQPAQRNLLTLSVWAAAVALLPTLYVAVISNSFTLFADLLRCAVEFLAILFAWIIARVTRPENLHRYQYGFSKLEQVAAIVVGIALFASFLALTVVAVVGFTSPRPVQNAEWGLLLAVLSVGGNVYLWQRNARLLEVQHSPLIDSQRRLFRAKAFASTIVVSCLSVAIVLDGSRLGYYADPAGSLLIAACLLYSSYDVLFTSIRSILDYALDEGAQLLILRSLVQYESSYEQLESIRTRCGGDKNYIELSLTFDGSLALAEVQRRVDEIAADLSKVIPGAQVTVVPLAPRCEEQLLESTSAMVSDAAVDPAVVAAP